MKIRNRITLWITGAGLLAGLLFSVVIFYEMVEQPYEVLDVDLDAQAHILLAGLAPENGKLSTRPEPAMLASLGRLYWFKVFNERQDLIYTSGMAGLVDLSLRSGKTAYNVDAEISPKLAGLEQDDGNKVTFRVRIFTVFFGGHKYIVQIARPMEQLQEEIIDLIISITVGLVVFTLALILLGYFAAGKILQPIAAINTLAREISEKTLDKRIFLGANRDELYILSSSLNRMFDRLQFSFQRQKEFLANASHELKTPIAMLRLFFDEARQRTDLPEEFQDRLDGQAVILFRMDRLVKNLLNLSALELKDSFEPTMVDLTALAVATLQEFDEIIRAASIQLNCDIQENIRLQADEEQLRRVLINLIDNAVKYNSGPKPEIRFSLFTDGDRICIKVYNTGQGIAADEQKLVCDQFYRIEKSRAATLGGSGLGLTIVKRIVELHHGDIEIESEYGRWARISIILPV